MSPLRELMTHPPSLALFIYVLFGAFLYIIARWWS